MVKDYKCPLGKLQPNKIDVEKIKKDGWRKDGILVIDIKDNRLTWPEKEFIKQIGNKIYDRANTEK